MKYGIQRNAGIYNQQLFDSTRTEGIFDIPILEPVMVRPERMIPFNHVPNFQGDKSSTGVHFFIDDYQFERIWNRPEQYIKMLQPFQCVCSPDWSMYLDMASSVMLWNHYRKQCIGQFFQNHGITIIPTVSWGFENSYGFCFQGIPKQGTIIVAKRIPKNSVYEKIWYQGMQKTIETLNPNLLLIYGESMPILENVEVELIQPEHLENLRKRCQKTKGLRTQWLTENPGIICEIAKKLGIPKRDWDDFRQEVILRSLELKDAFDPNKAKISTWATGFALRIGKEFRRKILAEFSITK